MSNSDKHLRAFGKFHLDAKRQVLWYENRPVNLALKEIELLCALTETGGEVVSKDELLTRVWHNSFVEESNLSRHIYVLRKTFRDFGEDRELIQTVPRRGYRFAGEFREVNSVSGEVVIEHRSITKTLIEEIDSSPQSAAGERKRGLRTRHLILAATAAGVLVVALLGGFTLWRGQAGQLGAAPAVRSIAVLPFQVINPDDKSKNEALGLADDLITRLTNIRQLNVRPTGAVAAYQGPNADPVETGRNLAVDLVLEGSVYHNSDAVRVTMRLLSVGGNQTIWSGQFERSGRNNLRLQDEIAERVVDALAVNLSGPEKSAVNRRYTDDDEAYQMYQKGRFEWNKRNWQGAVEAERLFRNAIDRDPKFALAYVGLADRLAMTSNPLEAYSSIEKALEIDPDLGEAHATLGFLKIFNEWDWKGAEAELKRSIEIKPGYATAHHWYATLLTIEGRQAEARIELERALEINPFSYNYLGDLGQAYYFSHDYENARKYCQKALDIYPDFVFAHDYLLNIDLLTGDFQGAMTENIKAAKIKSTLTSLSPQRESEKEIALASQLAKYKSKGVKGFLSDLIAQSVTPEVAFGNARVYAFLGDNEKALDNLEVAVKGRAFGVVYAKADPAFDPLHQNPRFQALLQQMNF